MQTRTNFQQEPARGREYEVAFSKWLQAERGYYTLPVFDCAGLTHKVAPHIDGNGQVMTAPDILACKNGTWAWFEVKLKEHADFHRISSTYVTGLPLRNWQHYLAVREATLSPVWLIFIHLEEREVMGGEIGDMTTHHIHHPATMDNGGTVFFAYNSLKRLMQLERLMQYAERSAS